jgi:putative ABC transport system permease protein
LPIKRWQIASGASFTDDDVERASNVCLIGETVRDKLFGTEDPVGQVVRLGTQAFEVVGVLAPKGQSGTGQDQDDTLMLPYTTAQKKLRGPGVTWLDDILCSAITPEDVPPAAAQITELMRQRHHIDPDAEDDFNIRHPEEVIKAQMEQSETFATLLISIASVSLLVGGIGIMNVMFATVTERTREIGVRLAIGASEGAVQLQFLMEAVLLCLFGGGCGVAASEAGASLIGRALGWTLSIPMQAILLAVAFSVVVGVVFGFVPARRAARLDPIAALRDE